MDRDTVERAADLVNIAGYHQIYKDVIAGRVDVRKALMFAIKSGMTAPDHKPALKRALELLPPLQLDYVDLRKRIER